MIAHNADACLRVVLADDHVAFRQSLRSILETLGGTDVVAESSDGEGALTAYLCHRPHVLVVDLRMPHLDGLQTIYRVLAADPTACILVLTTSATDHQIQRVLAAGAKACLFKDVAPQVLLQILHRVAAGETIPPTAAWGEPSCAATPSADQRVQREESTRP
ncbi:response regulator [Mycobacterium kansasii]|jgi:DNA-binding NarL/FixJ family response regulator|uniref:response regulator n=1 Tax=Mycobacterium kansasii TaxID=1768 RepID=UPI000F016183|nr:response regulator transcription factor [Mycobacterium kansasii]